MPGIRTLRRLMALVVLCLVVAPVTAPAPADATSYLSVSINKGYNWAQFSFTRPVSTKAFISISAQSASCAMSAIDGRKKSHSVTLPALSAATKYFYCVKAVPAKGKALIAKGNFTTDSPGPSDMRVQNGRIVLKSSTNYYPFTPVVSTGYACYPSASVDQLRALGINILMDATGCSGDPATWTPYLDGILANKLWLVQTNSRFETAVADLPQLLHRSEVPLPGNQLVKGVYVNTQLTVGSCNTTRDDQVFGTNFRNLKQQAASQPVVYMNDISTPWASGRENCYDVQSIEATLVAALIAGVQGFQLDTKVGSGNSVVMQIKPELGTAVKDFTRLLATFGPALRAGATLPANSDNPNVITLGKKYGGVSYLFVLNADRHQSAAVNISFAHAASSKAQVAYPGGGNVKLSTRGMSLKLGPLQWRVYRVMPK